MSQFLAPQIVLLKHGTDTSQGKGHLISNINACNAVVDLVRTTLGPRGLDKLIHEGRGKVTITNDGATIVQLLQIIHPAAKTLVDISMSQDAEVGDGTTSVILLAGEMMNKCKEFIEDGVHSQVLIRAFRKAGQIADARIREVSRDIMGSSATERREMLMRCAGTSLNSKLVSHQREFFAGIVTDAVLTLDADALDVSMVGIKKVHGGSTTDSHLVAGVAFKKTFSYAGFEQQPKSFDNPKVMLLNLELELKAEKDNAEVRVNSTADYQAIVDAEWDIIYAKLAACVETSAKVVLSRLAIGDVATQYFADRDIFCAGRVSEEDMRRVQRAVGGSVQTTVNHLVDGGSSILGQCGRFEERQLGKERYNVFTGCPQAKSATIIVRGGSDQFLEESERSLHDAIMIVRRAIKHPTAVPGGGAIEMDLSRHIRSAAVKIEGKDQLIMSAYARALEVIPRTLCDNAGFDSTEVLNKLRAAHASADGNHCYGVDLDSASVVDTWAKAVWEPAVVKLNALAAATEAACQILAVDETIKNPKNEQPGAGGGGPAPGGGPGGMGGMMGRGGRGVRRMGGR